MVIFFFLAFLYLLDNDLSVNQLPPSGFLLILFLNVFDARFFSCHFVGKIRLLVLKPNWSVMTSFVLAKAFIGTDP